MSREGPLGIPLQSLPGLRSSSGVEAGTSGFLSRADMDLGVPHGIQGVKDPFEAQKARWDFSRDTTAEKGLISH